LLYCLGIPAVLLLPWYGNILLYIQVQGSATYDQHSASRSTLPFDLSLLEMTYGTYGFGSGWPMLFFMGLVGLGIYSQVRDRKWRTLGYGIACMVLPFAALLTVPFGHSFDPSYTSFIAPMLWLWAGAGIVFFATKYLGKIAAVFRTDNGIVLLSLGISLVAYAYPLALYYKLGGRPTAYKRIAAAIEEVAPDGQVIVVENSYDLRVIPGFYGVKKKINFVYLETKPYRTRKEAILRYLEREPKAWLLQGNQEVTPAGWADKYFRSKLVMSNPSHERLTAMGLFPRPSIAVDPWVLNMEFIGSANGPVR
jgi:hypothetical protein